MTRYIILYYKLIFYPEIVPSPSNKHNAHKKHTAIKKLDKSTSSKLIYKDEDK